MIDDPDIGALRLLATAVREGSISAAAREARVTQQTASARLRGLEQRLGLELLRRSPRGVEPTSAGETVAAWAEEVLAAAERFRTGMETLRGEHSRELTVAASQTVAAHLLPRWLVALRERQVRSGRAPTQVRMLNANSVEVETLVRSGAADLGFIESTSLPEGLATTAIRLDALVVVVAPQHPWATRADVGMDEVADASLVVREEGSGTRRTWEDAVVSRLGRMPAEPVAVLSTSAAVRSAAAEGIGPAVLSGLAVADDVRLGRLVQIPLRGDAVRRPITALWRGAPRDLSTVSRELLEEAVG
ncbi:LysR family transcriptional regulator [Microbacterium arabinogalactanolyticum]|uniref:LysR family transcriptional regulator n=1 Tax=Microbacterium arabinogalactanolyticum TaxID=69365 RepID=UPI002557147E|nr:LysR family transcriptional regulator [Microbacterium arabinogalactanolyticum]GLC86789.1 LysR family transcriptional regulator [Microbacterium arabinogalactanolyticum]